MQKTINTLSCNFKANGAGDPVKRAAMHRTWAGAEADLIFQQEVPDGADNGYDVMYEAADQLGGMAWVLGEGSCTALFANRNVFTVRREWGPGRRPWVLPPAAASVRLNCAGPDAVPLIAFAGHLNFDSYSHRAAEGSWLTSYNDKRIRSNDGGLVQLPAIGGVDRNSYRQGDAYIPRLDQITDDAHRAHRSRPGPDGGLVMDTEPDGQAHNRSVPLRRPGLHPLPHSRATAILPKDLVLGRAA
ncbi:endonuclease/exonuclease/phosphatase family protein [Streptomyces sp. NPDC057654]|uniref:endonuclease/exonuclease/phosphatase family protein n=1 Tax=Streptomyces sp. NPDC057654 TaxID=3346196 RepID=UPI0036934037